MALRPVNPYLAFDTLEQLLPELGEKLTLKEAQKRYIKAVDKGMLKVMAKMGISTYQSYCGAQIFDAVGLKSSFVRKYFTGTHTQVEGAGLRQVARETAERHRQAFGDVPILENALDVGGEYAYRIRGEAHVWRPVGGRRPAARGARQRLRQVSRLRSADQRSVRAADDAALACSA
jgi:glutamate synthase (NADPH/NADH) large chain